jgi:hypothetical protein
MCDHSAIADCRPCTTAAACEDGDACTDDVCNAGVCVRTRLPDCAQPLPVEICGDCIDNDDNGLTDFEDPFCCAGLHKFDMALRRGRIRPQGTTSRLRLLARLAQAGLSDVNPMQQDVFLQIRPQGATDILCAHIPAKKFMHSHRTFKFWDRKHTVPSARGIDDMAIVVRRDGSVRFRTLGLHAQMPGPAQGDLQVTVAFHDATSGDAANRCSTLTQRVRTGRSGKLLAP